MADCRTHRTHGFNETGTGLIGKLVKLVTGTFFYLLTLNGHKRGLSSSGDLGAVGRRIQNSNSIFGNQFTMLLLSLLFGLEKVYKW